MQTENYRVDDALYFFNFFNKFNKFNFINDFLPLIRNEPFTQVQVEDTYTVCNAKTATAAL